MKIAVEGCAHGDLDNIYATLKHMETVENIKIDLLICCGDFQAVRNEQDLASLACPDKYKSMNTFWKYYAGEEVAPYPTLFIGGNHEASNYLWELYYGGWAAPRIFFLGFSGVIHFGGVRIGGLSGIYKPHDYLAGHHERAPYNAKNLRSIYHIREYDVQKLMQIQEPLDVFVSHDWPRGITKFGNANELVRRKPFLRQEIDSNTLGSKPAEWLLQKLKPAYWFSAHLHTKFAALVQHDDGKVTKFLALDKCLPRRDFLQVIDLPVADQTLEFSFDEEWLAITRAYNQFFPLGRAPAFLPASNLADLKTHREWVRQSLCEKGSVISSAFSTTVPPYNPSQARKTGGPLLLHSGHVRNPFTEAFLAFLELPYQLDQTSDVGTPIGRTLSAGKIDPSGIALDDAEDEDFPDDADELEAAVGDSGISYLVDNDDI